MSAMGTQFRDLNIRALKAFSEFDSGRYGEYYNEAREIIDQARRLLALPGQQLGVWETSELNHADRLLDAGFPRLALIAVGAAMAVFQLSANEYAFGFDAAWQHAEDMAKRGQDRAGARKLQTKAATRLLADQHDAATALT
ncbi:MAG: hypothetical protein M3N35_09440, partial [Candidatus Binatota bacterium]|nr:hypothetical protein [Candidatus Binatota bacterium]